MYRLIKLIILLMLSCNGFSQTDTAVVHLNRKVAVSAIKDLIACDFTKRESKILANTVTQQDFMLSHRKREIEIRDNEIQKRDEIIAEKDELIELAVLRQKEIEKQLVAEKRKKVGNKWFYFGLGAVSGYFGAKGLSK